MGHRKQGPGMRVHLLKCEPSSSRKADVLLIQGSDSDITYRRVDFSISEIVHHLSATETKQKISEARFLRTRFLVFIHC